MPEEVSPGASLVDQILDQMFERLKSLDEFDSDTMESLKELSHAGALRNAGRVGQVISRTLEERR